MQFKTFFMLALMALCAVQFAAAEDCIITDVYNPSSGGTWITLDLKCPESGYITKTVRGSGHDYDDGDTYTI